MLQGCFWDLNANDKENKSKNKQIGLCQTRKKLPVK